MPAKKNSDDIVNLNLSSFSDPLQNWPNDDILLSQKSRDFIAKAHPDFIDILDWPELRAEFEAYNKPANAAKKSNRRSGLIAILSSTAGLFITALTPIFSLNFQGHLVLLSVVLLTFGVFFGVWHLWSAKYRSEWLGRRYWTERLRQLYFQFLINNIELAARAIDDQKSKDTYLALRSHHLELLTHDKDQTAFIIENLVSDIGNASPWIAEDWSETEFSGTKSENIDMLLKILERQRIKIQEEYTQKKIQSSYKSPVSRAEFVTLVADLSTFFVVITGLIMGSMILINQYPVDSMLVKICISIGAALSTLILFLRVMDDALCLRVGARRYQWYLAATQSVKDRFSRSSDNEKKISLLREMERLSYQEMRQFIAEHKSAKFIL